MQSVDAFLAGLTAPAGRQGIDIGAARLVVAIGSPRLTFEAAADIIRIWSRQRDGAVLGGAPAPAVWPFRYPLVPRLPEGPVIIWSPACHEAFVNHQTGSTRLVTTQPLYVLQAWLDAIGERDDVLLVATAERAAIEQHAPEILARRGLFAGPDAQLVEVDPAGDAMRSLANTATARDDVAVPGAENVAPDEAEQLLIRAMRTADARERLALSVAVLGATGRSAPALLAAASACMEVNDLEAARRDLDEALALAPDWAAAHFERGKLWLRLDDMDRASAAFREAAERMPRFSAAWANLGATLGELGRSEEALAAFERALVHDPTSHQALNNIGVVNRELGRLPESEAAFRQVIGLAPALAFGYYNLGHTLFLQGRYQAALSAYVEGQRRDAERNPVQATRLALCRLATGDPAGALAGLQEAVRGLRGEYKQQLVADTHAVVWALLTHRPDLDGWHQVHDWLTAEARKP